MELLRTDRTILRAWRDDEAERLFDILRRPEVKRWIDDDFDHPVLMRTVEQARERIAVYRERILAPGPIGHWAVEEVATGVVAGTVLLAPAGSDPDPDPEPGPDEVEIGWHLHPDAQGRGLAREAAAALLAHALVHLDEVHCFMYPDNAPSAGVARAIGMVEQPLSVDRYYPGESRHFLARRPPVEP